MWPYLALALAPIMIKIIVTYQKGVSIDSDKIVKKKYCIYCGIALFLVIAFRSQYVGSADSSHYYSQWERLMSTSWTNFLVSLTTATMEKGYLLSVWVLSHIFPNAQFIFICSGVLFAIAISRFIYKNSDNALLSYEIYICLGLFVFMIQGMRQAMAMSICLLSIEFCKNRKLVPFVVTIFIASLFHQTALVFLVIYLFYGRKLDPLNGLLSLSIGILITLLSNQIVNTANDLFEREYTMIVTSGGFVATAIYIIIIIIGFIAITRYYPEDIDLAFFWYMAFFGFFIYIMRYFAAHAAQRISFYFMFSQMILLPNSLGVFEKRSRKLIKIAIVVLSIALFLYRLNQEGFIPFKFFWQ